MKVFICGITGTQGSALARLLLASSPPISVIGLSRDPSSPSSTTLRSLGVQILPGSYTDASALTTALSGCTALFLNLLPSWTDATAERRDGLAVLAAATSPGSSIKHIVYSTALSVDAPHTLPNYDPESYIATMLGEKHRLEEELRKTGVAYTILRPGNFMSNYIGAPARTRQRDLVVDGVSRTAFKPTTLIPMVDVATIAAFARAALLDVDKYTGQEIGVADELLTLDETLTKLSAATGRTLTGAYMTEEEVAQEKGTNPLVGAQYAMRDLAMFVDMEDVRRWGVPLSSFDAFLEREAAEVQETYATRSTA